MRKIITYLLAAVFMLTISGCGNSNGSMAGQDTGYDSDGVMDSTVQDTDAPVVYMTTDISAA